MDVQSIANNLYENRNGTVFNLLDDKSLFEAWAEKQKVKDFILFEPEEGENVRLLDDGSTAVLSLFGVVGYSINANRLESDLSSLEQMNVKKVILNIESPGGLSDEMILINETLNEYKEKFKFYSFVNKVGASAAYELAVNASDRIYATKGARTASIGSFATLVDFSQQLEKEGIKAYRIRSGEEKFRPDELNIRQEDVEAVQNAVNEEANRFIKDVAKKRNVSSSEIKKLGGAVLSAEQALKMNLIDGISSLKIFETLVKREKLASLKNISTNETSEMEQLENFKAENESLKRQLSEQESTLKSFILSEYEVAYRKLNGVSIVASERDYLSALPLNVLKDKLDNVRNAISTKVENLRSNQVAASDKAEGAKQQEAINQITENDNRYIEGLLQSAVRNSTALPKNFSIDFAKKDILNSLEGGLN